jgi:hemolysin III
MKHIFIKSHKKQTLIEELLNSVTHGIGALLGVAALVLLVVLSAEQDSAIKVVGSAIFGASLIIMYSASAMYHAVRKPYWKRLYKVVDHSSIYLLIAGSYTPVVLVVLNPGWGWSLFGVIWGLALLGLIFKLFATGKFEIISTTAYVCMGWLAIIAIKPLYDALPLAGFIWLLAGGISYTLGVIFYAWDQLRFGHAIWHLFVLGGSICHFFLILWYVVPA